MLPEQMRESTRTELFFDDLEKLPSMEVARICEWLTEKVDGFSSKTRAEPKEAEEEASLHSCLTAASNAWCLLWQCCWIVSRRMLQALSCCLLPTRTSNSLRLCVIASMIFVFMCRKRRKGLVMWTSLPCLTTAPSYQSMSSGCNTCRYVNSLHKQWVNSCNAWDAQAWLHHLTLPNVWPHGV